MDHTFNSLISRATAQSLVVYGDPWEAIPIKNNKCARETTEIHLANRNIQKLQKFEDFPNLEVLWLNDNKIEKLEGLDRNFRIKHLYLQNNKLKSVEGSFTILNHLETLSLYNNELRDLDKNIKQLQQYPSLKQLDLFENPLHEEPNYRLRVIYALPQLQILDRHLITLQEKKQADKLMQSENITKKKESEKTYTVRLPPSQIYSEIEKFTQTEAIKIKAKYKLAEEAKIREEKLASTGRQIVFNPNKVPKTRVQEELEMRKKVNPLSCISEWEKDKVKSVFKQFDKSKKGSVPLTNLGDIYDKLSKDECQIGISPETSKEEFIKIITGDFKDAVPWDNFRYNLNSIVWQKSNEDETKKIIKDAYFQGNKQLNLGNKKQAQEEFRKAIRLESKQTADNEKPQQRNKYLSLIHI
eukprot:TRINITY_DN4488_c0_g1_i3.p1 TRINITY_DN4488_c0_g1~~TRINITY_DN4488_c0_g1_i3.p1  ORF type:complete len:413 (+),score=95.67 TRINITY_DN4488_c0_g1_i3:169-1407(+)